MKVRATGLNARDLSIMRGALTSRKMPFNRIPLSDNAGDVVSIGPGVTRVKPGDRVTMTHYWQWFDGSWNAKMAEQDFASTIDGFLAEMVVVPADALVHVPDYLSYEEASTLQSAGLTAWNAIVESGNVRPSNTVLTLGTGGVSVFGLQWAKMLGATVIVTSSSDEKLERMRKLGADMTINYAKNRQWSTELMDLTNGSGVDVILNNVGISEMENCLLSCGSNGRIMYIGANPVVHNKAAKPQSVLEGLPNLILKDLTIKGIIVGSRRMFEDLMFAMTASRIRPVIDRTYSFEEVNEAIGYMESGNKIGKIVITIQ